MNKVSKQHFNPWNEWIVHKCHFYSQNQGKIHKSMQVALCLSKQPKFFKISIESQMSDATKKFIKRVYLTLNCQKNQKVHMYHFNSNLQKPVLDCKLYPKF